MTIESKSKEVRLGDWESLCKARLRWSVEGSDGSRAVGGEK